MKPERSSSPEDGGSILVANTLPSPPLQSPGTPTNFGVGKTPPPTRRRGTVACRRCRRLRTKCLHGPDGQAPCDSCRSAGRQAATECTFPKRGEKDVDRDFRRRPPPQRLSISSSSTSQDTPDATVSAAPAVQPLRTGASVPADAPVFGSMSTSPGSARHHSLSLDNTHLQNFSAPVTLSQRRHGPLPIPISGAFFPPHEDIVAGCRTFVTSYFQLGFLPKAIFIQSITRNLNSVSPFLLSCILSISARFTQVLVQRYGGSGRATENFLRIARTMVPAEMYEPSLERTQAFFLLAISEWGNGDKDRSSVHMGIAVRMAAMLKLHREETYHLPPGASPEQAIRAESARRTFWMIHSQENLHAGYSSPAPFPLEDITARLPCDEHDFAFGVHPTPRSVLPGTVPALVQPNSAKSPHRCLFATLIQSHNLWGQVARRACRSDLKTNGTEPWEPGSEYQILTQELRKFEEEMPERHRWSAWNLRGWKAEQLHLAYLAVVMVLKVSNIVERRIYLDEILFSVNNPHNIISPKTKGAPEGFWAKMANELFSNVLELHEQIQAFFAMRSRGEGFPAILVFCVYICGSLASYLWRYPQLCPRAADEAEEIAIKSLRVLGDLHQAWPTSTRWQQGLQQIASPMSSATGSSHSGSSSGDSPPTSCGTSVRSGYSRGSTHKHARNMFTTKGIKEAESRMVIDDSVIDPRLAASTQEGPKGHNEAASTGLFWNETERMQSSDADVEAFSNEMFEAEMSTLLTEDAQFGWLDFERCSG